MTRATRILARIQAAEPNQCWLWTGAHSDGYGVFYDRDALRRYKAHRVVYELLAGPIGQGLELDHLCRNTGCVNPAHLEPVTHRVNMLRGIGPTSVNAKKDQCKHGHSDWVAVRSRPGNRQCRACNQIAKIGYPTTRAGRAALHEQRRNTRAA